MISAKNALQLTKFFEKQYEEGLDAIVNAALECKTRCHVLLGTLLTEEQLKSKIDEYKNKGYCIVKQWVCTSTGGWREPETEIPAEYWAAISWE